MTWEPIPASEMPKVLDAVASGGCVVCFKPTGPGRSFYCHSTSQPSSCSCYAADMRAEVAEAAVARVEALADWYDAQVNWREWRIGASLRAALATSTDESGL